jgi:hypothetical protein
MKIFIICLALALSLVACNGFDHIHISGKYYLRSLEYSDEYKVSYYVGTGYVGIVKAGVKKYCYDDKYIYLQYDYNSAGNEYYLIEMCDYCKYTADEGVSGPYSEEEFEVHLKKLEKNDIEFEDI